MFTIVGLIVAVAAALILLVGVLHVGGSGMESSKASNAAAELAQLELGIQSLYSAQASFSSVTNTVALAAGNSVVPANMNPGTAGSIINEWGGTVTIAAGTVATQFTITETSVPQDACATLVTKVSNPVSITIAGTAVTFPVDVGAVTAACTSSSNTLVFTFGH